MWYHYCIVSIGLYELCFSRRVTKDWRQEEINPSLSETIESARIIILLVESFSHKRLLMVFYWSLNDSKSLQESRTLLSILADINSVVVWMISTRPLISKPTLPFNNPSVTVPRAYNITGINVTFMFRIFFNSFTRIRLLSLFSLSFNFTLSSAGTAKFTILLVFFCCRLLKDLVVRLRLGDGLVC